MAASLRAQWTAALRGRTTSAPLGPHFFPFVIGIDPGTKTGVAIWWNDPARKAKGRFLSVDSMKIHEAMERVSQLCAEYPNQVLVRFEDARQRKWFGDADQRQERSGAGVREGVGSVKRDSTIWHDWLRDKRIPHQCLKPTARGTKWSAEQFKAATGYEGRTNEHGRDAGLLAYGISSTVPDTT